jgi:hypothetical protein
MDVHKIDPRAESRQLLLGHEAAVGHEAAHVHVLNEEVGQVQGLLQEDEPEAGF